MASKVTELPTIRNDNIYGSSPLEPSIEGKAPDGEDGTGDKMGVMTMQPSTSLTQPSSTLHGWRFAGALFALIFGLLLSVIETSITATALVTIGRHFNDQIRVKWVVLCYLLAYMGFAVIIARLSDVTGRRETLVICWLLFGGFSLGCGLSKTLNQLIGFRVLQGIGGSGLYTMTFVLGIEITPPSLYGVFSALLGITFATGSVLGPILGGVITQTSTWRWCYLFNAPCTIIGVLTCLLFVPSKTIKGRTGKGISISALSSIDFLGASLLVTASALLVFALETAGSSEFNWNSDIIIVTLTIAGASWIGFFVWTTFLTYRSGFSWRPIVPLRVFLTRPTGPAILVVLLAGFPHFIAVINLPQRFQIVNGNSPIMAGVHLLPLLCSVAVGSAVGAGISTKRNFTAQTVIAASCLILLGCGLLSTVSDDEPIDRAIYGYEVILGLGVGLTFSSMTLMVNVVSSKEDNAAAQGVISQARIFGGSIGLSIATIIFNSNLAKSLSGSLSPSELKNLQQSLSTLSNLTPEQQSAVGNVFASSFNDQMRLCTYVSAFGVIAALGTLQKSPIQPGDR